MKFSLLHFWKPPISNSTRVEQLRIYKEELKWAYPSQKLVSRMVNYPPARASPLSHLYISVSRCFLDFWWGTRNGGLHWCWKCFPVWIDYRIEIFYWDARYVPRFSLPGSVNLGGDYLSSLLSRNHHRAGDFLGFGCICRTGGFFAKGLSDVWIQEAALQSCSLAEERGSVSNQVSARSEQECFEKYWRIRCLKSVICN